MNDQLELALQNCIRENSDSLRLTTWKTLRELAQAISSNPQWGSAQRDADRMEAALHEADNAARQLLLTSGHSREYWYHLIRRFLPLWFRHLFSSGVRVPSPAETDLNYAVAEIITTATDFALRFLPSAVTLERTDVNGREAISFAVNTSTLDALVSLGFLAEKRFHFKVSYRLACKDLPLPDPFSGRPTAELTADDQALQDYERRQSHFETLTGSAGLWYDPAVTVPLQPRLCGLWATATAVFSPIQVVSKHPSMEFVAQWIPRIALEKRFVPDHAASTKDYARYASDPRQKTGQLVPYDTLFSELDHSVQAAFGVSSAALNLFLYAIARMVSADAGLSLFVEALSDSADSRRVDLPWNSAVSLHNREEILTHLASFCKTGLASAPSASWALRIAAYAREIVAEYPTLVALNSQDLTRLVDIFTLDPGNEIDPLLPALFRRLSDRAVVLDLLHTGDFLRHLFLCLNAIERLPDGRGLGPRTANWHEQQAAGYFERVLGLRRAKMIVSLVLPDKSSQVDLAFVHNRILFVIDCKAMAKDREFITGTHSKLRNRRSEFLEELSNKCKKRAKLIRDGRLRPTIDPSEFDSTFSMVCTTAVEYLDLRDERFALRGFSFVGPPEELLLTIEHVSTSSERDHAHS